MANQTLTEPYVKHIPISFKFLKNQSPNELSVGKWAFRPSDNTKKSFKVPPSMQIKLIDIIQPELLPINLLFGCRIDGAVRGWLFNVNKAYRFNNTSKPIPHVITAYPSEIIEFIAYPIETVKEATTEVVNAILLISPVSQLLSANPLIS